MSGERDVTKAAITVSEVGGNRFAAWLPLAGILALSLVLNAWGIWAQGITNEYYAAAVRSMLANPGMLLFNSLDPAGFVTVDKPPVGLWVQALSAALFGFSGWSLVLPQALASFGSVVLVYLIVSRPFDRTAGLIAGLALALTPIFVAISRNGTMDGLLIFVLLLALFVVLKAAREGSFPLLLVAAALVGIGFNIKMIQAWILIPALIGVYVVGARTLRPSRRILHLGIAMIVLVGVSLSWAVAVDSVPADERPYIGGSGDNTVLGLIINYNGLHRLENGGTMGTGTPGGGTDGSPFGGNLTIPGAPPDGFDAPPGAANWTPDGGMIGPDGMNMTAPGGFADAFPAPLDVANGSARADGPRAMISGDDGTNRSAGRPAIGGDGVGMMDQEGQPGMLRLFGEGLAGQLSWLLPFALIGLVSWARRPPEGSQQGITDMLGSERGLVLLGASLWLFPGLAYFSFTTGFWHTYYLATIAPPLTILVGCGVAGLYAAYRSVGYRAWLLPITIAVTGLVGGGILLYTPDWSGLLTPIVLAGSLAAAAILAVLLVRKRMGGEMARIVVCIALILLFLGPLAYALTPIASGSGGNLPTAGPSATRADGGRVISGIGTGTQDISGLTDFLVAHQGNATYIAATSSSNSGGAALIIATGKPVMVLGGFTGSDEILTTDELAERVQAGEVRYFLVGGVGGPGGGESDLLEWVQAHGTLVDTSAWGGTGQGYTLYDCGNLGSA